jgi:hypothetical protein
MMMSLFVALPVMSLAATVRVKPTKTFVVLGVLATMSQSTRWTTRPEKDLPFNSAQPFPSNATADPSWSSAEGLKLPWLMSENLLGSFM